MPSGPSHSHSSGGRSGGGFSSSRSGGSFHSFGGGRVGPRPPMHMHFFGRTVIVTGGKQALLSLLIFFFIFCTFLSVIMGFSKSSSKEDIADYNSYIRDMEVDNGYYVDMIEKAKANEDGYHLITIDFTTYINYDYYTNDEPGVYYLGDLGVQEIFYIVYSFENPYNNNELLSGVTYAQFTKTQIYGLHGELEIAYHKDPVDGWVSMNTSYPTELSSNREYLFTKELVNDAESSYKATSTIFTVVLIIDAVIVVAFVLTIVVTIKNSKKEAELEEAKKKEEIRESKAKADALEEELKKKNRVCDYCGCSVPDDATKCPVCGASKFKKKK